MFIYNEKTVANITFKMLELFRTIKADKEIKANAKNVLSVKLSNTLSPERTNLEASESVKEIYVMDIELNTSEVPTKFIEALNKYINFQILFRLHYKQEIKYNTSLKVFADEKVKILKTFESEWKAESKRDMPLTTKLENVFKAMVADISHYNFRQDESFEEYANRLAEIKKLNGDIDKQTRMMNAEKQPNIKMSLNDKIKEMKKELQRLEA